jgi:hypothetical protein
MDVIPLDATLIKGSHGRIGTPQEFHAVLISDKKFDAPLVATDVYDVIWKHLIPGF